MSHYVVHLQCSHNVPGHSSTEFARCFACAWTCKSNTKGCGISVPRDTVPSPGNKSTRSFDGKPWRGLLFQQGVDQHRRHACHHSSQSSLNAQNTCLQMSLSPTIQTALLSCTLLGKMENMLDTIPKQAVHRHNTHHSPSTAKHGNHTHPCKNAATSTGIVS